MHLKRTVYHIAGKDYESTEMIEFTFYIQRVSINNFLNLEYYPNVFCKVRRLVKNIGDFEIDFQHTNVDSAMRPITICCMIQHLFVILQHVGIKEWHSLDTISLWVRNSNLRAVQHCNKTRYNGISVFDPTTKKQKYTSGSPKKIEGRQAIINGKLWRKYYTKYY
jgi:hypothetical protein